MEGHLAGRFWVLDKGALFDAILILESADEGVAILLRLLAFVNASVLLKFQSDDGQQPIDLDNAAFIQFKNV